MNEALASITLDSELKIADFSLEQKHFRFKCKRCATLCCKLGGPLLTRKDVERIEAKGYPAKDFLEPVNNESNLASLYGNMKNREDGSCIFLEFDVKLNCYKCSIYDSRPLLCRLYPFSFETGDSNRIALKFIPCCRGLNNPEGEPFNENFVTNSLLEPLLEAIELHKKGTTLF
jgi:Fe-S-cluster containining protein